MASAIVIYLLSAVSGKNVHSLRNWGHYYTTPFVSHVSAVVFDLECH